MDNVKQFLREFNELWVREDTKAILAAVTDDIRFSMAGETTVVGKPDFEKFLSNMEAGHSDMGLTIDNIIVEGERAAVNGEIWITDTNGVRKAYAFCDLYRLAGDKVAELTAFVQEIK